MRAAIAALSLALALASAACGPTTKQDIREETNTFEVAPQSVQCTLEAKLCPDGIHTVHRVPPSCAFAACPEE
jgi:hypothetical protein